MKMMRKKSAVLVATALGGLSVTHTVQADVENTRTNGRTGDLDVSVDYQPLEDAMKQAEAQGIQIFRDSTMVRRGNAKQVKGYIEEANSYHQRKAEELKALTNKYRTDLATYEQTVKNRQEQATLANGEIDALKTSLAALGRGVTFTSKTYSDSAKSADVARLKEAIRLGELKRDLDSAVNSYQVLQNGMVGFQTQLDQGNIKLQYETVTIRTPQEVETYKTRIKNAYQQLQTYVNQLRNQPGSVPDASKPTLTLYNVSIAPDIIAEWNKPTEAPLYQPIPTDKVPVPQFTYAFYDIRQTSDLLTDIQNKDGEQIVIKSTNPSDKGNVHQAMKNQTIAVVSTNDPLPSGRFDKYHSLVVKVKIPDGQLVTLNETLTNVNNPNWHYTFDERTRTVTFSATDDYLVTINEQQKIRNGTIGGIMAEPFYFDVPAVYAKLLKDNMMYEFTSDVLINHEYKANSGKTYVRTDQADPTKHNYNDRGVMIDGRTVWFGTTNNYTLTWDFDQYRAVNIDREMQAKGLDLIDFYPADALDFLDSEILIKDGDNIISRGQRDGSFNDTSGHKINGLTWSKIDSYPGIDRQGPAIKVSVKGFDHPYYKQYVEGGKQLKVVIPMITKVVDQTPGKIGGKYGGNSYTNVAYQSDFGNIYKTNEVTNTVAVMDPRKDAVLDISRLESLDTKANPKAEIEKGTYFQYRIAGSKLQLDVLEDGPRSYSITDTFHAADQYDGVYFVESNGNIQFKRGTALYQKYRNNGGRLPADTDITKFTTQTIRRNVSSGINTPTQTTSGADSKVTKVFISVDQDFLDQIDYATSVFQLDFFLQAKRVQDVDNVTNIAQEEVNGYAFDSNQVVTNTKSNRVDDLEEKVTEIDGKIDDVKEEMQGALSVVRKKIQDNTDRIIENKRNQDDVNKKIKETIGDQHKQIENNRMELVSIRRLINSNNKVIKDTIGKVDEKVDEHIKDTTERLDEIDKLLEQTDSELTIYLPTILTDAQAVAYAIDHGVAPRAIKDVRLDTNKRFVVIYNTSKTAINNSPQADIDKDVREVKALTKTVTFYQKANKQEALSALLQSGYKETQIAKVEVDGTTYHFTIDLRTDAKDVVDVPDTRYNEILADIATRGELEDTVEGASEGVTEDTSEGANDENPSTPTEQPLMVSMRYLLRSV